MVLQIVDRVAMIACLYCHGDVDETRGPRCPECSSAHHLDCWEENGGCSKYGCPAGPKE